MIDADRLGDWIAERRAEGWSDDQIRSELVGAGWDEETVDEHLGARDTVTSAAAPPPAGDGGGGRRRMLVLGGAVVVIAAVVVAVLIGVPAPSGGEPAARTQSRTIVSDDPRLTSFGPVIGPVPDNRTGNIYRDYRWRASNGSARGDPRYDTYGPWGVRGGYGYQPGAALRGWSRNGLILFPYSNTTELQDVVTPALRQFVYLEDGYDYTVVAEVRNAAHLLDHELPRSTCKDTQIRLAANTEGRPPVSNLTFIRGELKNVTIDIGSLAGRQVSISLQSQIADGGCGIGSYDTTLVNRFYVRQEPR